MPNGFTVFQRANSRNWYVRVYGPSVFAEAFGKREVVKSTGTSDKRTADANAAEIAGEVLTSARLSHEVADHENVPIAEPSDEEILASVRYVYVCLVEDDQEEFAQEHPELPFDPLLGRGTIEGAKSNREYVKELHRQFISGNYSAVSAEHWAEHDGGEFGRSSANPLFADIQIPTPTGDDLPPNPADGAPTVAESVPESGSAPSTAQHTLMTGRVEGLSSTRFVTTSQTSCDN
ncbi:MAG: DUF6538 domain-containing protein [Paracoccaceae bacterium]